MTLQSRDRKQILTADELLARVISANPAQVASAGTTATLTQRTLGQQLLLARTPSHVARILPRSRSAAENTASFLFGS